MERLKSILSSHLREGLVVTVLGWKPYPSGHVDRSYEGDVLEVVSIALPYVVVEQLNKSPFCSGYVQLDTRLVNLAPLPKSYIDALVKPVKQEKSCENSQK